jgi:hypothetical protein
MDDHSEAVLLRIFIGESDHWHGKPLHLALVEKAREQGLAGATVLRGIEGFGARSVIHATRFLELSTTCQSQSRSRTRRRKSRPFWTPSVTWSRTGWRRWSACAWSSTATVPKERSRIRL